MSELSVDPQHPWLGLASFTEDTRAWFYGRDDEVTELARIDYSPQASLAEPRERRVRPRDGLTRR